MTTRKKLSIGAAALIIIGACALAGTTNLVGLVKVCDLPSDCPTGATATAAGELLVEGDAEVDGNTDLDGTLSVAGASTLTGAATLSSTLAVTGEADFTDVDIVTIEQADVGATCTLGQLRVDTATTKELCYCAATNTWYCISFTTATGPTD